MACLVKPFPDFPGDFLPLRTGRVRPADVLCRNRRSIKKGHPCKRLQLSGNDGAYKNSRVRQDRDSDKRQFLGHCHTSPNVVGTWAYRIGCIGGKFFRPSLVGIDTGCLQSAIGQNKSDRLWEHCRRRNRGNDRQSQGLCRKRKTYVACRCDTPVMQKDRYHCPCRRRQRLYGTYRRFRYPKAAIRRDHRKAESLRSWKNNHAYGRPQWCG